MSRPKVCTPAEAMKALGGHLAVAKMYKEDSRVVSNWLRPGRQLPSNLHWSMGNLLRRKGYAFDPAELFQQRKLPE